MSVCDDFHNQKGIKYKVTYKDLFTGIMPERTFHFNKNAIITNSTRFSKIYKEEEILNEISMLKSNPLHAALGHRPITAILKSKGYSVGYNKVLRLMRTGKFTVPNHTSNVKYCSYEPQQEAAADNLIKRNFYPQHPGQTLLSDVTQCNVQILDKNTNKYVTHKVLFSPVIDSFTNEIVAYGINTKAHANDMIIKPLELLNESGYFSTYNLGETNVIHTDQGTQYFSKGYKEQVAKCNLTISMSRKGNCLDNASCESFHARFKDIVFRHKRVKFSSLEKLYEYIQAAVYFWNNIRPTGRSKYNSTPIEARKAYSEQNNKEFILTKLHDITKSAYDKLVALCKSVNYQHGQILLF